jgi:hypothetical protein
VKLTHARFIAQYNNLGVRFVIKNRVVVPVGHGVSPAFAEWVAQRSNWLKPGLTVQCENSVRMSSTSSHVSSTHADRLVWDGIQNARKAEAKVKAIVKGNRYK